MCDHVVLLDGTELWTVGELREIGLEVTDYLAESECLCSVDLPHILLEDPLRRHWRRGFCSYQQVDEQGRTWEEDAHVIDPNQSEGDTIIMVPNPAYPWHDTNLYDEYRRLTEERSDA